MPTVLATVDGTIPLLTYGPGHLEALVPGSSLAVPAGRSRPTEPGFLGYTTVSPGADRLEPLHAALGNQSRVWSRGCRRLLVVLVSILASLASLVVLMQTRCSTRPVIQHAMDHNV